MRTWAHRAAGAALLTAGLLAVGATGTANATDRAVDAERPFRHLGDRSGMPSAADGLDTDRPVPSRLRPAAAAHRQGAVSGTATTATVPDASEVTEVTAVADSADRSPRVRPAWTRPRPLPAAARNRRVVPSTVPLGAGGAIGEGIAMPLPRPTHNVAHPSRPVPKPAPVGARLRRALPPAASLPAPNQPAPAPKRPASEHGEPPAPGMPPISTPPKAPGSPTAPTAPTAPVVSDVRHHAASRLDRDASTVDRHAGDRDAEPFIPGKGDGIKGKHRDPTPFAPSIAATENASSSTDPLSETTALGLVCSLLAGVGAVLMVIARRVRLRGR